MTDPQAVPQPLSVFAHMAKTDNKALMLAPLNNILTANYSRQGTKITIGFPGNVVGDILHGRFVGGLILCDKDAFEAARTELAQHVPSPAPASNAPGDISECPLPWNEKCNHADPDVCCGGGYDTTLKRAVGCDCAHCHAPAVAFNGHTGSMYDAAIDHREKVDAALTACVEALEKVWDETREDHQHYDPDSYLPPHIKAYVYAALSQAKAVQG